MDIINIQNSYPPFIQNNELPIIKIIKEKYRGISIRVFTVNGYIHEGKVIFPYLNNILVLLQNGTMIYILGKDIVAFCAK
ncbi:hypothetical protein [Anaerophilus nitritogenes]|uniref:hypothetical protein n=1 Tax=Anaerophilus nitritogenes TaxID=2498136 RepID=UPI00101CD451|nr:hypothetical protein [Anaerophilus nitritogenes]